MCHARIDGKTLRKLLEPEKLTINTERVEKRIQDTNAKVKYKKEVDDAIVELAERVGERIPVQMISTSGRRRQQRLRFRRKGR